MKVLNELRQFYPLDELLRAAEIPRSTFYYHLKALSKPDKYADVKKRIGEIYHENRGRYGYRRVTLSLHREGKQINHKAVQRLMGTLSLKAAIKVKRYRSYRGEVGQTAPNVLQRDFKATRPNEKWVTDVTEFAVNGRKLYLSPVIDLFNNEVISYSLSERPVMNMVENMLDQAMEQAINAEIQSLIAACQRCPAKVVLVTNEVGMGIVPESRLARHFRDIAGRVNQQLAAAANEVWLVVSGIGVKIK